MPFAVLAIVLLAPMILGIIKGVASIYFFIKIVEGINYLSGKLIDSGVIVQNFLLDPEKITAIQTVWGILRDFVNIFFILILLAIAFATIFNVSKYKASDLLPKLIIAALLINFSLVITIEIVKVFYIPAAVFLKPLGQNISGKIVDALNIQKFFDPGFIKYVPGIGEITGLTEEIFRSMFLIASAFILTWIALIIWIRIPIIIGLMIVSPIAWLGYTLPPIKEKSWDAWWKKLLNWASIPALLFGLIYFIVYFNSRLTLEINQAVPDSTLNTVLSFIGFNTGQFLVWIVTVGLFWFGINYIKGLTDSTYGWTSSLFRGIWGGVRGVVGGAVDLGYQAFGYKGAVGQVQKRMAEEGFPILGKKLLGTAGRETRGARVEDRLAGMLGLSPTFAAERNTTERAEKAMRDIENRLKRISGLSPDQALAEEKRIIAEAVDKGPKDPEGLAGLMLMAKNGQLDINTFNDAVRQFEKMPLVLTRIFSEWKEGKFGGISIPQFQEIIRDSSNKLSLDAKRVMTNFMASDDGKRITEDRNYTYGDYTRDYQISGGKNWELGRRFRKFTSEARPTIVGEYNYNFRMEEFDNPADRPADIADAILKQIKKTGSRDFTKYGMDVWNDPEFKAALRVLLYNKATTDINNARKYAEEVRKWLIRESKDEDELRIFNDTATMAGI